MQTFLVQKRDVYHLFYVPVSVSVLYDFIVEWSVVCVRSRDSRDYLLCRIFIMQLAFRYCYYYIGDENDCKEFRNCVIMSERIFPITFLLTNIPRKVTRICSWVSKVQRWPSTHLPTLHLSNVYYIKNWMLILLT